MYVDVYMLKFTCIEMQKISLVAMYGTVAEQGLLQQQL